MMDEEARESQLRRHRKRLMEGAFAAILDGDASTAKSHLACLSDEEKQRVLEACRALARISRGSSKHIDLLPEQVRS